MNVTNQTNHTQPEPDSSSYQFDKLQYLSLDFFYNLLPCYLFILVSIYRYFSIKKEPYITERAEIRNYLTGITDEIDENLNKPTPSLILKTKLSYANAFIYLLTVVFAFIMPSSMLSAAEHPFQSLLYLFGFLAWWLSALLVGMEFRRGLNQELYTHRIFWMFAGGLTMVRLFQKSENYFLNFIFNIFRLFFNSILTIYAMFKPYDRELTMGVSDEELPTWARSFFLKLETNRYLGKILGFEKKEEEGWRTGERTNLGEQEDDDLEENLQALKRYMAEKGGSTFASTLSQEQFLLKSLPSRRAVAINKKPIKKLINSNEQKIFYQIITQINQNRYITERKFVELVELEKEMKEIYNPIDFPNLTEKLPLLLLEEEKGVGGKVVMDFDVSRRIDTMERYIQDILKTPAFIHAKVLIFLEVGEEDRLPFLAYFEFISKGANKGRKRLSKKIEEINKGKRKSSVHQAYTPEREVTRKQHSPFEIACIDSQKSLLSSQYEYVFQISHPPTGQTWKFAKSFPALRDFHNDLENKLGNAIPYWSKFVAANKITGGKKEDGVGKKEDGVGRKEGLDKYMKAVCGNRLYLCDVIFEFVGWDGDKERRRGGSEEEEDEDANDGKEEGEEFFVEIKEDEQGKVPEFAKMYAINKFNKYASQGSLVIGGINFNMVFIRVYAVKSFNNENGAHTVIYYFSFEEYKEAFNNLALRTQIKIGKKYSDFQALHQAIWKVYRDLNVDVPFLPAQKLVVGAVVKFDPKERKKTWENFFFNLLKLPKIEENESFREFFNLNRVEKELEGNKNREGIRLFEWI